MFDPRMNFRNVGAEKKNKPNEENIGVLSVTKGGTDGAQFMNGPRVRCLHIAMCENSEVDKIVRGVGPQQHFNKFVVTNLPKRKMK